MILSSSFVSTYYTFLLCSYQAFYPMQSQKLSVLVLKQKKEKPIRNFHHWIFDGAMKELSPEVPDGGLVQVLAENGEVLGIAYVNRKSRIIGRMLAFGAAVKPVEDNAVLEAVAISALSMSLDRAIALRRQFFDSAVTNAYRLVNSEGDGISGLIVDWYAEGAVLQITTLGMEQLKPKIVEMLRQKLQPKCIYEKSTSPSRKEEGMGEQEGWLWRDETAEEKDFDFTVERSLHSPIQKTPQLGRDDKKNDIIILENGVKFLVDIVGGQKTGFYLDQREMRSLVGRLAHGRRVLNCFSYTGGFSVFAALGGAESVVSVDDSEAAIEMAKRNVELNKHDPNKRDPNTRIHPNDPNQLNSFGSFGAPHSDYSGRVLDVFDYLRQTPIDADFIILDPPAFAKKKADLKKACRAYQNLNRMAMQKITTPGLLLTCSCSYAVDERLFQQIIFEAALQAGRRVRILSRHREAFDHPVNIYHPEGRYLKGFLLAVD